MSQWSEGLLGCGVAAWVLGPKLCLSVDLAGGVSYPWVDGLLTEPIGRGTPQGKLARSPKPAANGRQLKSCSHDRHEV